MAATRAGRAMADLSGATPSRRAGPDRVTTGLLAVTAFLVVLAVLASNVRATPTRLTPHRVILVRRIYQTSIIDDRATARSIRGNSSVTQSVATSGSSAAPAVSTRASSTTP